MRPPGDAGKMISCRNTSYWHGNYNEERACVLPYLFCGQAAIPWSFCNICNKSTVLIVQAQNQPLRVNVSAQLQGWKLQKYFSLSFGKVAKKFTCPPLFLPVLDMQTDSNFQNFSLSFGKVSKIFTCPALFLPVPDRRTACNFHPCQS